MRDKIIEDYKILLAVGWMEADEDGLVSVRYGDELMPATINGQRIVLPTRAQLKDTNWKERIGFHPIREPYNLGVSDLLSALRDQYVSRLNTTIGHLMKQLIAIGYDQANQKNLTSDQGQVLNALTKVTETLVKSFDNLLKNTHARNNADQFINIRIQRAGVVNGTTYGRAGLVTFPIYEQLTKSKDEPVNGVKFSAKDRVMVAKLFEFILPSILTGPEAFNVGVASRGAPFLESLVRVSFNVISELVERSKPYLPIITMPSILQFPENLGYWIEVFDDKDMVERMASTIPSLSEHTVEGEEPKEKREPVREQRKESEIYREEVPVAAPSAPAGPRRMVFSSSAPAVSTTTRPSPTSQDRSVTSMKPNAAQVDRNSERARREEIDREQRARERQRAEELRKQEEADRREDDERRRQRDREDRERERQRDRERSGRDYDDRGRDGRGRDYDDRDRDSRSKTGDIFEDNPILRGNMRDRDDRNSRYDRDRGRPNRVRDIRDRDPRDRGRYDRDDRYYDDRGRDRDRYRGR